LIRLTGKVPSEGTRSHNNCKYETVKRAGGGLEFQGMGAISHSLNKKDRGKRGQGREGLQNNPAAGVAGWGERFIDSGGGGKRGTNT